MNTNLTSFRFLIKSFESWEQHLVFSADFKLAFSPFFSQYTPLDCYSRFSRLCYSLGGDNKENDDDIDAYLTSCEYREVMLEIGLEIANPDDTSVELEQLFKKFTNSISADIIALKHSLKLFSNANVGSDIPESTNPFLMVVDLICSMAYYHELKSGANEPIWQKIAA